MRNGDQIKIEFYSKLISLIIVTGIIIALIIGIRNDYKSKSNTQNSILNKPNVVYPKGYETNSNSLMTQSPMVWVNSKDKKYHTRDCVLTNDKSSMLNIVTAVNEGYTPCEICKPPIIR